MQLLLDKPFGCLLDFPQLYVKLGGKLDHGTRTKAAAETTAARTGPIRTVHESSKGHTQYPITMIHTTTKRIFQRIWYVVWNQKLGIRNNP